MNPVRLFLCIIPNRAENGGIRQYRASPAFATHRGSVAPRRGHSLRLYRRAAHPYLVEALLTHLPRRDNRIARLRRLRRARPLQRLNRRRRIRRAVKPRHNLDMVGRARRYPKASREAGAMRGARRYGNSTSTLKNLIPALFSSVTGCHSPVPSRVALPFSTGVEP